MWLEHRSEWNKRLLFETNFELALRIQIYYVNFPWHSVVLAQKILATTDVQDTPREVHCWYAKYKYSNFKNLQFFKFDIDGGKSSDN